MVSPVSVEVSSCRLSKVGVRNGAERCPISCAALRRAHASKKRCQLDLVLALADFTLLRLGAVRLSLTTSMAMLPPPRETACDDSTPAMHSLSVPSSMERKLPLERRELGAQETMRFSLALVMAT